MHTSATNFIVIIIILPQNISLKTKPLIHVYVDIVQAKTLHTASYIVFVLHISLFIIYLLCCFLFFIIIYLLGPNGTNCLW